MGMREWANNHPRAATGAAAACVLACLGGIAAEVMSNRHTIRTTAPDHYYSVDDGKTFFTTSGDHVAPFDYQGGTAVRAYVFECGGHRFVGYLERYTPEFRKLELGPQRGSLAIEANGRELKRPGDATWVSSKDHVAASKMDDIACPAGSADTPMPVEP